MGAAAGLHPESILTSHGGTIVATFTKMMRTCSPGGKQARAIGEHRHMI
jgi:hypothetical protein